MSQKDLIYDSRYDELLLEVEISRKDADKNCECYYSNPALVQVGTQSDTIGNVEPLYVHVSTCSNCGAKEIH